jgi:hypothetical protein
MAAATVSRVVFAYTMRKTPSVTAPDGACRIDIGQVIASYGGPAGGGVAPNAGQHEANAATDQKTIVADFMKSILLHRAKVRFTSTD